MIVQWIRKSCPSPYRKYQKYFQVQTAAINWIPIIKLQQKQIFRLFCFTLSFLIHYKVLWRTLEAGVSRREVVYIRRRHGNWKNIRNKRTLEIRVVTSGIFDFETILPRKDWGESSWGMEIKWAFPILLIGVRLSGTQKDNWNLDLENLSNHAGDFSKLFKWIL